MPRLLSLLFTALFAFACLAYLNHERLSVATSLVATFTEFHHSSLTVASINDSVDSTSTPLPHDDLPVPAIIHQVKLGGLEMRPTWVEARQSCMDLHPSWAFHLWEDAEADAFVRQNYPQLFEIYRGYPLEIQRSNVLRYLVLHRYGGIYLDLDLACHHRLDFLRNETFLTPPANPTGVNNAFIVSARRHPFWSHLIDQLPRYNLNWHSPYLTNMFSTGCHFFSTMHRTYPMQSTLHILDSPHKLNGHVTTPLFEHLGASSWHKGDAKVIIKLDLLVEYAKRQPMLVTSAMLLTLFILLALAMAWRRHKKARKLRLDLEWTKLELD